MGEKERKDFCGAVNKLEEKIRNTLEQIEKKCAFLVPKCQAFEKFEVGVEKLKRWPCGEYWKYWLDVLGLYVVIRIKSGGGVIWFAARDSKPEVIKNIKALLNGSFLPESHREKAEKIEKALDELVEKFIKKLKEVLTSFSSERLSQQLERAYDKFETKEDEIKKLIEQKEKLEEEVVQLKNTVVNAIWDLRKTKSIAKSIKIAQIRENLEKALKSGAEPDSGFPAPDPALYNRPFAGLR